MKVDLVCLGEPLLELNETKAGVYTEGVGGDVNNCAIAAARSSLSVGMLTALGDDPFAATIRNLWQQENIHADLVETSPSAATGMYFICHDEQGHHFTYARKHSAASQFTLKPAHFDAIQYAKILHISGISLAISSHACDMVYQAIDHARKHGVKISFDTNFREKLWPLRRASAITNHVASLANYVFPGFDDAQALTGLDSAEAIADFYRQQGAELVALTLGADGVYLNCTDFVGKINAHQVEAIDATAAGDTYDGAFLAALLRTGDALKAAHYANAASAICVSRYGAISAIPTRQDIEAFVGNQALFNLSSG